jgi:AraC-like DNA-binding protein
MNRTSNNSIPKHVLTPKSPHSPAFKSIPFGFYQRRHQTFDWHRHGFYELMMVETGSGTHEIDFKDFAIEPRQFFVLHPNQVHRLRRADLLAGRVLIFDASFLGPELRQLISEHFYTWPCLTASAVDYATLITSFGSIQAELSRPDQTVPLLTSLVQTFFLQLLRARQQAQLAPAAPSDFDYRLFVQFKSQLDQAVPTADEVNTYADRLAVTGRKLNEVSRRFTGKTARQLLNERVVLEAKRLLAFSADEVKTIAFQLDFADPYYFSRFFKRHAGVSPEQFRAASVPARPGEPSPILQ